MAGADKKSGREHSGRDPESIRQRLDTLGQQLADAKARRAAPPQSEPEARGAALGKALRLATELIAGVAVGGFIGWALDRLFGSAPFLMVVFLILGAAAGILNVVRAAKAMQAEVKPLPPGKAPPAVLDDDDD
jgi:ATP synthase protein I